MGHLVMGRSIVAALGLIMLASMGLSGCQNTSLGEQLQGAVAPKNGNPPPPNALSTSTPAANVDVPKDNKSETQGSKETNPLINQPSSSPAPSPLTRSATDTKAILWLKVVQKTATDGLQQSKFLPLPLLASRSFVPEDVDQAPTALQGYIRDLTQLGVINPRPGKTEASYSLAPNAAVTRREYVRWLVGANNRFYANQPSRQVRLAQPTDQPSFSDIAANDADFAVIQGLANAGLLPINTDSVNEANNLFRPDEPLTRQEMVVWKIPFDIRQPLPIANLDGVKKAWGFRDLKDLNTANFGVFVADAQLGEQSNVRRAFGFTVLLQPNKTVTRGEAIATLWYFGTATDGISARRVQQLEQSPDRNDKPSTPSTPKT